MVDEDKGPIRILHVLGGMTWGGVETWLLHVLRHIDRERFHMDFLVHTDQPCPHDDEVRALGGAIIPCLDPSRPWLYARNFNRIMREHGPYDVVHSHVHHYSGYVLLLAGRAGVPVRLAHSHNDTSRNEARAGMLRRRYLKVMEQWIHRYATGGLAASRAAALDLFGPEWAEDARWRVLHYAVDLDGLRATVEPNSARAELGIPADAFVIGHAGRFAEQKNHAFLVDIAAAVAARDANARVLLVGDGPLLPDIERQVARTGLADRVVFVGARYDVPRLMQGAMDVFLLPSFYEGLPVALIEAQALGLPCVYSDVVTEEADAVARLVRRVSLSQPPSVWADTILAVRDAAQVTGRRDALGYLEKTSFDIRTSIGRLERIYAGRGLVELAREPILQRA